MSFEYQEIKRLYFQAFGLEGEVRTRFLDGLDPAVRARVAELLKDDDHDDRFLAPIQGNLKEQMPSIPTVDPMVGRQIGPYTLERQIASGGMGAVYLASRKGDYKQLTAIKLIRSDAPTNQEIVKRFRHERQFLASLKHPGIAALLDGGTTDDGMPYFVMEYVDGRPITKYCDEKKLCVTERLKLFQRVCKAVQYCHQRGVIHRDLKPDNILITREGDPKLVDFGIAKVTNVESSFLTSPTPTSPLYRFMTIEYASPEQVKGEVVSTLSDVYSLGVILYELLTGRRPLDIPRRVQSEIERIVSEEQPRNPSDVVTEPIKINKEDATQSKTDPQTTATLRQSAPESLRRELQGDLDTIVLMALKKDADRRYESVEEFANDIQRYFDSQPVIARPDSAAYRVRKFVARNRLGVAAASVLAVVVVGAFLGINAARQIALNALHEKGVALTDKENALTEKTSALTREKEARERADLNADAALRQKQVAERYLYMAHMNLAQSAWERNHVDQTVRLLDLYRPVAGQGSGADDLRGFEWFYWDQRCHSELLTLKGHTDSVKSVAFSLDGKRLASASDDRTVKVWDATSGQEMLTLEGHTAFVNCVAFSPNGKQLASAGHDGMVKIWDATSGQELLTLKEHTFGFHRVAFSPDGKRLASANYDGSVKTWDAASGQELLTFKGGTGRGVDCMAFSSDGKRLAATDGDGTVKVWDATSAQETVTLKEAQRQQTLEGRIVNFIHSVAFGPDWERLASEDVNGMVKIWDVTSGQELPRLKGHPGGIGPMAFSPNAERLASASHDGTVKVWDATSGQDLLTFVGHTDRVNGVAFSPDGKRLASASGDGTVKVWDATSGQETLTLNGQGFVNSVTFSPDGKRIAAGGDHDTLKVWDAASGQEKLTLNERAAESTPPDGEDATSRELRRLTSGPGRSVYCVAFSTDGKRLASTDDDGTVKVWDATSGQKLLMLKGRIRGFYHVAFSPDGKRLASGVTPDDVLGIKSGTVKIWDATSGQEMLTLKGDTYDVNSVAFSPDGKRLASASDDHMVKVWDATSGEELLTFNGETFRVNSVVFSPDGKRLASANYDGTVKIWDATTGQDTLTFVGHTGPVNCVAFSRNGKRLASASNDMTVKVWDPTSGQELLTLNGHTGGVKSVAFSPDGKRLASASDDRTVKVWGTLQHEATSAGLSPQIPRRLRVIGSTIPSDLQ